QPATQPAPQISRTSLHPNTGLWSLKLTLPPNAAGTLLHNFPQPLDLHAADTLQLAVAHMDSPARSATYAAAVVAVDSAGTRVTGDFYPLFSQWQTIPLDLPSAATPTGDSPPLDLAHIASIGLALKPLADASTVPPAAAPLDIQTDSWAALSDSRPYTGFRLAPPNSFYAERHGTRILVGLTGSYELAFSNSSTFGAAPSHPPFLSITQGTTHRLVLGQPNTGLMLLDPAALDALAPQNSPATPPASSAASLGLPTPASPGSDNTAAISPWPGAQSTISFECTWASPVAVLIEAKQQVGPYDRLSRPAAALTWRFMVYQRGQVFVHVDWTKEGGTNLPAPNSWALALDAATLNTDAALDAKSPADAQRLLAALYPQNFHANAQAALPHQMQPGAPVAMLAKTYAQMQNPWWWADHAGGHTRFFGNGIPEAPSPTDHAPLDAMLLVNAPNALAQASSFSQYLSPPRLRIRQGELDRNFPGDPDNDGFVDSYGFQVIRLASGRAAFTVYPDNRPLFYPAFLFTIPAVERPALDLPHERLLINIDGKQFADPPQFPDGSFLLQLPYTLDRPVSIEALLVKK
ncbi:MAG TPA: hypothetical protein VH253_16310, partial [Phycisphaerae bacterium]|nr:hypothetical protein [Phycisphaerae bacterium]